MEKGLSVSLYETASLLHFLEKIKMEEEEMMAGGWREVWMLGCREGWKTGWTEGWRNGWWEGYRKGGTKEGMEGGWREEGMEERMEGRGMEGGFQGGWAEGWMVGQIEGERQGCMEGLRQGWMETGMEGGKEGGMEAGWMEGWREGWKEGWRLKWKKREDGGMESEMDEEMEAEMEETMERWREGWKEGWRLKWKKREDGGMEGGMEAEMEERMEAEMEEAMERWREVWMDGWRLNGRREEWREGYWEGYWEGSQEAWIQGWMVGIMDGGMEQWKDFDKLDIDELETEMEVMHSIKKMICHSSFESLCSKGRYDSCGLQDLNKLKAELDYVEIVLPTTAFRVLSELIRQQLFDCLVFAARDVLDFIRESAALSGKQFPRSQSYDFRKKWENISSYIIEISRVCQHCERVREIRMQSISKVIYAVRNPSDIIPDFNSRDLLLKEAFPALHELKESSEMFNFLSEVIDELDKPITDICSLCEESSPSSIHLIGGLLSFKRSNSDAWRRVHGDLKKVIEHDYNDSPNLEAIFSYCFDDLPEFLQECLQYLACYPLDSDIPATWLTKLWIAEGFVKPEKGETLEETASNYLEQFVRRSLVSVSKRSYSGTIKYCRINYTIQVFVSRFVIDNGFLVVNPVGDEIGLRNRIAIHPNIEYPEVKCKPVRSFLAFDLDRDLLGRATYLRVLELRNSSVQETTLPKLCYLQYLGLRGSNIRMLPENIGNMKDLKTLDVRDTNIEILPESLWSILALRHVYTNPRPQIQGPPPTANLSNLHILKTVVVPESWLKNFPHSMINLRKLALSNMDNPTCKPNPYWESISNLLSKVVNLLSMTIKGDIVPAEFVDTRAFPNLESVKSIKLEGRWNYFKLTIDNNEFPQNLTKLTLTKSGLKEDPMPRLERLQALKYLSLKDGAYMGKKMVCSANGFPQLDFLELAELKNLEIWEANPMAMPQLTKLRVVKCCKLENLPDLEHVSDKDIVK